MQALPSQRDLIHHTDIFAAEQVRDELELVAYVISHDLKAPLRAIEGTSLELKNFPELANENGQEAMRALVSETARLKIMMQAVVDYLQLETFVPATAALEANDLAQAAMTMLQPQIVAANAIVTCDVLPPVTGHKGRLTRVFVHLLENALRFKGEAEPRVHISARRDGAWVEFCVTDNGIGIDEENHEIIFKLFQRLHADAYPGYGIGLALAAKTAKTQGGEIWVDSSLGKGSRFYFTVPAVP